MTDTISTSIPDPALTRADRSATRKRVAACLQWACTNFPATLAADEEKALIVAELILREVEGRRG